MLLKAILCKKTLVNLTMLGFFHPYEEERVREDTAEGAN